jgi:Meckel syndrome type 1 protein
MARLKLGQAAEAEADCTAALALEPTYVKALQRRAAAHSARGQLLQAASDLDTASRLEPGSKALRAERAAAVAAYEASAPAPAPPPTDVPVRPLPQQARAPQPPPVVTPPPPPPVVMPPAASPPKRGKGSIVEVSDGKPVQAAPAPRAPVAALDLEALAAEAAAKVAERPLEAAPRSGLEYEQAWAQAAGRPELQLRLLQLVPPATLPALLKNALSAAVLIAVQRAALTLLLPSAPDDAFAVLRALTTVPRFQMATMLVAGRDKAALQADWEAAVAAAPPQVAEPLRALRASFRV